MSAGQSLVTRGLVQEVVEITVQQAIPLVAELTVELQSYDTTVALDSFDLSVEVCNT